MMGIYIRHNTIDTQTKLRSLGFHCPMGYNKYFYQLIPNSLCLRGQDTKPKQRGTVILTDKELDQVILLKNLGLSLHEALTTVVHNKFIKE